MLFNILSNILCIAYNMTQPQLESLYNSDIAGPRRIGDC